MTKARWTSRSRNDLIVEVWEKLDCESVGAREIELIDQAIREKFGEGAAESPASIARTVADEGAVLRHSEVFECDLKWRERASVHELPLKSLGFTNLGEASESIRKLESLRRKYAGADDQMELRRLRDIALKCKQDAQLVSRSRVVEIKKRLEAGEIAHWLTVWLQGPQLFEDWLNLRKRSPEFIQKFGG
jgi:hypothetical protein